MTLEQVRYELDEDVHQEFHNGKLLQFRPAGNFLRGVQIAEFARYWPIAEPLLHYLIPYGRSRYSIADFRASIESGKRWLWLSEPDRACVMLTQVIEYPRMDVMMIFGIAGKLPKGWRGMLASLEGHARSIGCKQIELHGRKGWARKLADYDPGQIVLTKVL